MNESLYGIAAEFSEVAGAVAAAHATRSAGYCTEAYGPFPVPELAGATGFRERRMAPAVLVGGLVGAASGYALQYYATVIAYPHNIGGRPLHSWPSFIPITFELGVLGATLTGIVVLLVLNRLPRLSHPVFSIPGFERASRDRFFVCVRIPTGNEMFSVEKAEALLRTGNPLSLFPIPNEETS